VILRLGFSLRQSFAAHLIKGCNRPQESPVLHLPADLPGGRRSTTARHGQSRGADSSRVRLLRWQQHAALRTARQVFSSATPSLCPLSTMDRRCVHHIKRSPRREPGRGILVRGANTSLPQHRLFACNDVPAAMSPPMQHYLLQIRLNQSAVPLRNLAILSWQRCARLCKAGSQPCLQCSFASNRSLRRAMLQSPPLAYPISRHNHLSCWLRS